MNSDVQRSIVLFLHEKTSVFQSSYLNTDDAQKQCFMYCGEPQSYVLHLFAKHVKCFRSLFWCRKCQWTSIQTAWSSLGSRNKDIVLHFKLWCATRLCPRSNSFWITWDDTACCSQPVAVQRYFKVRFPKTCLRMFCRVKARQAHLFVDSMKHHRKQVSKNSSLLSTM